MSRPGFRRSLAGGNSEYEKLNKALNSPVFHWEKDWTTVQKFRVYDWVKTERLANELTDNEESDVEMEENDPGTPGLVQVDEQERDKDNDFNNIDESQIEEEEKERELNMEEKEKEPDDYLIEKEAEKYAIGHDSNQMSIE